VEAAARVKRDLPGTSESNVTAHITFTEVDLLREILATLQRIEKRAAGSNSKKFGE
jgi:hypothetical protein